jgi:hypothetical protein
VKRGRTTFSSVLSLRRRRTTMTRIRLVGSDEDVSICDAEIFPFLDTSCNGARGKFPITSRSVHSASIPRRPCVSLVLQIDDDGLYQTLSRNRRHSTSGQYRNNIESRVAFSGSCPRRTYDQAYFVVLQDFTSCMKALSKCVTDIPAAYQSTIIDCPFLYVFEAFTTSDSHL